MAGPLAGSASRAGVKSEPCSPVVDVQHLSLSFPAESSDSPVQVLKDVTLTVSAGEFVAIVGPSGCGKTTLLNVINGLEPIDTGHVRVAGAAPRAGNPEVGYLFARDALLPWRTALQNVELPMLLAGVSKRDRRDRAREALAAVGLGGFEDSWRAQLSQGMRQRVAIARTLASQPTLIFMDEPFSALDAQTRLSVQERFLDVWQRTHATVMLITHDLAEAISLADRVVVFTNRPARVKRIFTIDIPRPRSVVSLQDDRRFHEIYSSIWQEVRAEVEATSQKDN